MQPQAAKQDCFTSSPKARKLATKAKELYLQEKFIQAKKNIDKLNKIFHTPNSGILELHACIEFDLGNKEKGMELIDEAIRLSPRDGLYTTKGIFFRQLNKHDEAIRTFQKALTFNPQNTHSIIHIAETYLIQLRIKEAYLFLRKTRKNLPNHTEKWRYLFNQCLTNFSDLDGIPIIDLYNDLLEFLNNENSSLAFIGKICFPLILSMKNDLNIPLSNNQLLITCLTNGIITNVELELALIHERNRILKTSLVSLSINKDDLQLASALAINAYYSEYITYYSEDEKTLIEELYNLIQTLSQEQASVENISNFILLYIMYEPINNLNLNNYIEVNQEQTWSQVLKNIIQWSIINPLIENELKDSIEQFTDQSNSNISNLVRQQYEENPYPRWITLHHANIPLKYINSSKSLMLNAQDIPLLEEPKLKFLVAGCGTGQHPLTLSKIVPNADILAIDLSFSSLAYAKRMSHEYEAHNIRFMQADILSLANLTEKFDIVETVGVLHHMENPEQGLTILRQLVNPKGIIRIGLYSTIARKKIIQLRQVNQSINMQPNRNNIRKFRHAILLNKDSEYYKLANFTDFYSTSSCRDLLFHRQEHTFTIPQLEDLFTKHQLKFLGFQLKYQVLEHYKSLYPDDPSTLNLKNWHEYEQNHPKTFAGMYQFHCQVI